MSRITGCRCFSLTMQRYYILVPIPRFSPTACYTKNGSWGLQHFATQVTQGQHLLVARLIADAKALGGNTLGELAQLEVFRQSYLWVKNYRCVHNKEIFFVCLGGVVVGWCTYFLNFFAYMCVYMYARSFKKPLHLLHHTTTF